MPRLALRPDADGFAFQNNFNYDPIERAALASQGVAVAGAAVAALALNPFLVPVASTAAAVYLAFGPLPGYGLCGGMAYAALDYWRAKLPLPRGTDRNDEPMRFTAGDSVRNLLWSRLLDSLGGGGVLSRTLEWMLRLHVLPGLTGGARWLRTQTEQEWTRLKSHLDNGEPWPIALVGRTLSIWDQHQVLAYGYEITGGKINLLVYDPNAPHPEGLMDDTVLALEFQPRNALITGPSLTAEIGEVEGFFCSNYSPATANPALAVDYGLFVNQAGTLDKMPWGARLPINNASELITVGGNPATVRSDPNPPGPPSGTGFPRDGALLRDHTQTTTMVFQGGAPFPISTSSVLSLFGGPSAVQLAPAGSLARFKQPPKDGTLLREISQPAVFVILNGEKCWITTPAELENWGGFPSVRLVPDGALSSLPTGPNQPAPQPGQCDNIKKQIADLEAEIVTLQASVDLYEDADNPRAAAPFKHHLEVDQQAIQALQNLSDSLGCP
jgi:hypothetical protein